MKTRFLTLLVALIAMAVGVQAADGITSLKLTIKHNGGKSFTQTFPSAGWEDLDLTDEKTTSLIIEKVEVETSGTVTDVAFNAVMYNAITGMSPKDEFRSLPLTAQADGTWTLEMGDKGELVESDWNNKTKAFEFYVQAKNSSGKDIYYNNGSQNYKVIFTTGEGGSANWQVKFYKDETATLNLVINGKGQNYTFTGDAVRTPGTDQQPGQLASLVIDGFTLQFIRNDGISINDVSIQYKVYEEGQSAGWGRIDAQNYAEESVYNKDKGVYENRMTYSANGLSIDVAKGLERNKNYVLEIMYQVVTSTGEYFFLGRDQESSLFKFSISTETGSEEVTISDITRLISKYLNR